MPAQHDSKSLSPAIGLLLVIFLTLFVYWPGLSGPLILDDIPNLKPLLPLAEGTITWFEAWSGSGFALGDRPVSMLSFILNFHFTGSDVWSLKLTNLCLHLLCGCLVFLLGRRLLQQPVTGVQSNWQGWLALWIAAAWLLVPLQVSTTFYVVQRMAQLPALFMLAGMLCYVIGRQSIKNDRAGGLWLIGTAFLLFWPLATLSKENGIVFPLLVLLVEIFFFQNGTRKVVERRILGSLLILVLVPVVILCTSIAVDPEWLLRGYERRDFTLYERLITQPRILFDYIANLLLIPGGSGMGLFHDDFVVSTGFLKPLTTLLSMIALIAVVVLAVTRIGTKAGAALFGIVFYLAAHVVESGIFPLELYFEHRNYLPGFGIFFTTGLLFYHAAALTHLKKLLVFVMVVILAGYAFFTGYRVDIWRSWDSILLSSVAEHPDSLRVQRGLAIVYIKRGDRDRATEHLERAEALDMPSAELGITLKYLLASCYARDIPPESAYKRLADVDQLPNDYYTRSVMLWFVESVEKGKCSRIDSTRVIDTLRAHIERMDVQNPDHTAWEFYIYLARLLAWQEKWSAAIDFLNRALVRNPNLDYADELKQAYQSHLRQPDK